MKRNNKKRVVKKTMTFIGEGFAEKAFILHLRSIYGSGKLKVTPKSAGGKGPDNVISDALGTLANTRCDYVVALLDTDLDWPVHLANEAAAKNIVLIGSTPCLEGLLLKTLGKKMPKPPLSGACKKKLHPLLSGKETCKESYEELFTKEVLDRASQKVPEVERMIALISGAEL